MSNDKDFGISIKDYAAQRNKTIQAVYQQMKRKENAAALEGHVLTHRVGNKDVKFLDDEAVRILDDASSSTKNIIVQNDREEELAAVTEDLERLKQSVVYQEGKIDALKDQLAEKEKQLMALAEPAAQIDMLKAQIGDLKTEKDELKDKVAEADKRALEANSEAYKAKRYADKLEAYLKLPKLVQLFTKKPMLENLEDAKE